MDSESKKAYHYVFAEKYTQQEVDEMLEQQRQMCADAVMQVTNRNHGMFFTSEIREACLDATGESESGKKIPTTRQG